MEWEASVGDHEVTRQRIGGLVCSLRDIRAGVAGLIIAGEARWRNGSGSFVDLCHYGRLAVRSVARGVEEADGLTERGHVKTRGEARLAGSRRAVDPGAPQHRS